MSRLIRTTAIALVLQSLAMGSYAYAGANIAKVGTGIGANISTRATTGATINTPASTAVKTPTNTVVNTPANTVNTAANTAVNTPANPAVKTPAPPPTDTAGAKKCADATSSDPTACLMTYGTTAGPLASVVTPSQIPTLPAGSDQPYVLLQSPGGTPQIYTLGCKGDYGRAANAGCGATPVTPAPVSKPAPTPGPLGDVIDNANAREATVQAQNERTTRVAGYHNTPKTETLEPILPFLAFLKVKAARPADPTPNNEIDRGQANNNSGGGGNSGGENVSKPVENPSDPTEYSKDARNGIAKQPGNQHVKSFGEAPSEPAPQTANVNQQGANAILNEEGTPNGIQNGPNLTQEINQLEQTITEGEADVKAAGKFDQGVDGGEAGIP